MTCCDSHRKGELAWAWGACCDIEDCGPCCQNCPTCPTTAKRPLAIELSGRSEAYRFRNERGQIIGHTSVPKSDDQAYDEAAWLAKANGFSMVFIERRTYIAYPWQPTWVNLLFYWDESVGDLAA